MNAKSIVASVFGSVNKRFLFGVSIGVFVIVISAVGIMTYSTIKNQLHTETVLLKTRLDEEIAMKEEALAQLENVIRIRNTYRANLKEIVELLYNRDTYLGVGGLDTPIPDSDAAALLQMQTVISGMNDDLALMGQVREYLVARSEFINSFPFIWPVKGGVPDISSDYGFRYDPMGEREGIQYHAGIDIPGELGTPIQATASGRVAALYTNKLIHGDYGNLIIIQHEYGFQTYYAHLEDVTVAWGEYVEKGQIIGYMGNTGKSTGVHIHYEIRHNNVSMNPMNYLLINY